MEAATVIPEQLKGHVCLLPDKKVLVAAKSVEGSPMLDSYISELRKKGTCSTVQFESSSDLKEILKKHEAKFESAETDSDAQKLVMAKFEAAAKDGASDVHFILGSQCCEIKFRIDGDLFPHSEITKEQGSRVVTALLQSMCGDQSHTACSDKESQSARIKVSQYLPKSVHAIRIQKVPHTYGQYVVARLLYDRSEKGGVRERLVKLGYSEDHARSLEFLIRRPHGQIIFGGGTGQGKSTTLKNVMEAMCESMPGRNHISVEDPPEYPITGTIQIDASKGRDDGANVFAEAIADALRLDPDVLMIGEVRDERSAHAAVRAAMSGHLVLTTIHANTATNILTRYADLLDGAGIGDSRSLLTDVSLLSGLVSQRLVKMLCPHCSTPLSLIPKAQRSLELQAVLTRISVLVANSEQYRDTIRLHNPVGCERCRCGHSGRTVVAEVIVLDADFHRAYREKGIEEARHYWLCEQDKQESNPITNSKSMIGHAIQLILAGKIDPLVAEATIGHLNYDSMFEDGRITAGEIKDAVGTEDTL